MEGGAEQKEGEEVEAIAHRRRDIVTSSDGGI